MSSKDFADVILSLTDNGAVVEIDGVDLATGVVGVDVHTKVGQPTTVTLSLMTYETMVEGQAQVTIPEKTRDALIALGWAPPPADEAKRAHDLAALLLANPLYRQLAEQADERGLSPSKVDIAVEDQRQFGRDELRVRLTVDLVPAGRPADDAPAGRAS